jgi:RTX calcium-binding nonapeptide repeat (4 copies)
VTQYQTLHTGALRPRRPGSRVDAGLNAFGIAVVDRPTAARDVLHGTAGANVICGLGGGDVIRGLGGADTLYGDGCGGRAGSARAGAAAAGGADRLYGGAADDRLYGGPGRDLLHGGPGNDRLNARDGRRDRVVCGRGRDVVKVDPNDRVNGCERLGPNSAWTAPQTLGCRPQAEQFSPAGETPAGA